MSLRATSPLFTGASNPIRAPESPIRKLALASSQCATQGQAYAQCISAAQFGNEGPGVEQGICQAEFQAFKDCVQQKMGRKW